MPAGRPTKYNAALADVVLAAGAEGKTLAGMADAIDVDRSTLAAWMEIHPEFSNAVKRGLEKAQAWWEEKGRVATFDSGGFNATSYIFNMKNRFKDEWSDVQRSEHTGKDGGPIETVTETPQDRLQRLLDAKSTGPAGDTAES